MPIIKQHCPLHELTCPRVMPDITGARKVKVKYTWICIARLCANAPNALRYGSHGVTCKQHHICLYSQSQSITAL